MIRKTFGCFALSLLPLFSTAQVLMDDVSEEELKAAFQYDCDQIENWGDPGQTCLSARYQQWNAMGGYSDGYAKSWAEPMVLAYRTKLAEEKRKLEAIAEAERKAEAARIAEEERIAAITAREQQTKIETEEALNEFSQAADPELTCDLLSPPLENDEDFVRSISGTDEYGILSNVPYLSLGNSTRACIADPCSYRCKVIFDWQLDPSSAGVALDALVDSRLAAAAAERAAQQARQEAEAARLEAERLAEEEKYTIGVEEIKRQMTTKVQKNWVSTQVSNWIVTFTARLEGWADTAYKFKGTISCFDEWDDKLGSSAEVVGILSPYDEDAARQMFGSLAPKDAKYTTTLGADFNQLEAKMDSSDVNRIESCTFRGLKIKEA